MGKNPTNIGVSIIVVFPRVMMLTVVIITQSTTEKILDNLDIGLIMCPKNLRLTFLLFMVQ